MSGYDIKRWSEVHLSRRPLLGGSIFTISVHTKSRIAVPIRNLRNQHDLVDNSKEWIVFTEKINSYCELSAIYSSGRDKESFRIEIRIRGIFYSQDDVYFNIGM